jgi:hypothetical protein
MRPYNHNGNRLLMGYRSAVTNRAERTAVWLEEVLHRLDVNTGDPKREEMAKHAAVAKAALTQLAAEMRRPGKRMGPK